MANAPLEGIRIVDLTSVWSGPHATQLLGNLGAEVIKVEPTYGRDRVGVSPGEGVYPGGDPGDHPWNRSALFNRCNPNKLGITLDLSHPTGITLLKRLIRLSDVVVENYSARVMGNFGLDYPALAVLNPAIIAVSMPGFGKSGPQRNWVSFGPTIAAAAGLTSLTGYEDGVPHSGGIAYADPVAGLSAANAILVALWHRHFSGRGQHIDLSQQEATIALIGEAILGFQLTGKLPEPMGNRHPHYAPHGCYSCTGEDKWVVIAAASDGEWQALCRAMGKAALADDGRFADQISRYRNRLALDEIIAGWTKRHGHYEVMQILQKAGVAAGPVLDAAEVVSEPQLRARDFFVEVDHPEAGREIHAGQVIRLSDTPGTYRPAPCLGQHNEYVLGELLGLSDKELLSLQQDEVITTEPIGK